MTLSPQPHHFSHSLSPYNNQMGARQAAALLYAHCRDQKQSGKPEQRARLSPCQHGWAFSGKECGGRGGKREDMAHFHCRNAPKPLACSPTKISQRSTMRNQVQGIRATWCSRVTALGKGEQAWKAATIALPRPLSELCKQHVENAHGLNEYTARPGPVLNGAIQNGSVLSSWARESDHCRACLHAYTLRLCSWGGGRGRGRQQSPNYKGDVPYLHRKLPVQYSIRMPSSISTAGGQHSWVPLSTPLWPGAFSAAAQGKRAGRTQRPGQGWEGNGKVHP